MSSVWPTAFAEGGGRSPETPRTMPTRSLTFIKGCHSSSRTAKIPKTEPPTSTGKASAFSILSGFSLIARNSTLSNQIIASIANGLGWEMQSIDVNGDYLGVAASQPIYYAFSNGGGDHAKTERSKSSPIELPISR